MFRSVFVVMDSEEKDVCQDGRLSCAYFISCLLKIFDLISAPHATVKSAVEDMIKNGWEEVKEPQAGDVLIWEKKKIRSSANEHIGFYLGEQKAVSNNYDKRNPIIHHFTYNQKRKIIRIFRHKAIAN